ncbi:MAG: HAMP domain-containing histidine kinase [Chloroflexi bacterium]|nr:HAMP domain-containing histidine kinase [Chloroflexota bacterium]
MRSLGMRLALAFLAVIVVSVGGVALLASRETNDAFQTYVERGRYNYLDRVVTTLQEYYRRRSDWGGIDAVLPSLVRGPQDRLVVADRTGMVVADSEDEAQGQLAATLGLGPGVDLEVDGQRVGTLYASLTMPASWRGPRVVVVEGGAKGPVLRALMEGKESGLRAEASDPSALSGAGGRGAGAEREARRLPPRHAALGPEILRPPPTASSPEASFMERVGRALLVSALAAAALAALLSLLLARQLAQPLRELAAGARALAAGNLRQRVRVAGHDEVGELALAFNEMAASLERAETARRNLVADVAHELRTPLTVIEGTVDAMLDGVYPADPERLESIRDETRLLAKLVADLRELSLADVGALRLEREPLEPGALVRRAVAAASARAAARGVELSGQVEDDLPLVLADEQRVTQVLANLLDNALRYTPAGGTVTVAASATPSPQPGVAGLPGVCFAVQDTGPGIAPDDLPHIFERFYRADPSRSRRSGGSGLGLAIARGYIEAHGGRIWAESTLGAGTTIRFWLPASAVPARLTTSVRLPAPARA